MVWEENSRICLHMQLIAILSRIGVGIITCLPTISTFAVLRLSAYPHFAPHPSLYISVTVSERRAWSLSSRKASASILPWRTARRRRMTEYWKGRSWTQERPSSGTEFLQGSFFGDSINVMLTASAYNLKRAMRLFLCLFKWVIRRLMTEGQWSVITYNAFTCAHV